MARERLGTVAAKRHAACFQAGLDHVPQGQFAVAIRIDDPDQSRFPIGAEGRATIYTNPKSGFVFLRKIAIRAYSWYNWIYPFTG